MQAAMGAVSIDDVPRQQMYVSPVSVKARGGEDLSALLATTLLNVYSERARGGLFGSVAGTDAVTSWSVADASTATSSADTTVLLLNMFFLKLSTTAISCCRR